MIIPYSFVYLSQRFLFHRLSNLCLHNWTKLNIPYIYSSWVLQVNISHIRGKKVTWQLGIDTKTQICVTWRKSGLPSFPSRLFNMALLKTYNVKDMLGVSGIQRSIDQLILVCPRLMLLFPSHVLEFNKGGKARI